MKIPARPCASIAPNLFSAERFGSILGSWLTPASWPRIAGYAALATLLHLSIIALIVQRRDLSDLDRFVFIYLVIHLVVDIIRLVVGGVILLRRGSPRLAALGQGEWPALTVVVPCHNEAEVIADTLHSLRQVDYPNLHLIVVDDGSTDATAVIATEIAEATAVCNPPLRVLRQHQAGKAAALNTGIAAVHTPLTLLVDADCMFPREGLRDAVRHLLGEQEDALGGHLAVLNQDNLLTRLQQLEYGDKALRRFLWRLDLNLSHTQDVIPGALGLFRTDVLRAAGPLSMRHLAEDVALTARLVEQGYRLVFSPYLQAATVVPDAVASLRIQRRRWVRGYAQVVGQQLLRFPRINSRARMAALTMALKTVRWPIEFSLSLVYCLHAWSQGQPSLLLLSLLAMLFPFSLSGLSRFLRSDGRTLVLFTYGYGLLLLAWRVWDQVTLLVTPAPSWESYRRRSVK